MKTLIGLFTIIGVFILSGCFDIVEETTIKEDGSGVYTSTTDMSKMLSIIGAMGEDKTKDLGKLNIDSTMQLADMKDSTLQLTAEEKKLIEKGTARLMMNVKEEKLIIAFNIPFSKPADILAIDQLLSNKGNLFQKQMGDLLPGNTGGTEEMEVMAGDDGGQPDLDNYFDMTFEKSKLKKKLNKERYANVEEDKSLKSLMEMGQMGMPVSFKTIINLPKPAKKAEGKGLSISDDKKKVTIEGTLDDFMEDASKFEYEIEF